MRFISTNEFKRWAFIHLQKVTVSPPIIKNYHIDKNFFFEKSVLYGGMTSINKIKSFMSTHLFDMGFQLFRNVCVFVCLCIIYNNNVQYCVIDLVYCVAGSNKLAIKKTSKICTFWFIIENKNNKSSQQLSQSEKVKKFEKNYIKPNIILNK